MVHWLTQRVQPGTHNAHTVYKKLFDECQFPRYEVDGILTLDQSLRTHMLLSSDQKSHLSSAKDNGSSLSPYSTTGSQFTNSMNHPSSSQR